MRLVRPCNSFIVLAIAATGWISLPAPAHAQAGAAAGQPGEVRLSRPTGQGSGNQSADGSAERLREDFREVLRRYPPALPKVLKLDPSLMANPAYLAPYPGLTAFLTQHPEVVRTPSYFLEGINIAGYDDSSFYRTSANRMWDDVLAGIAGITVFLVVTFSLGWLVRTLIDYRRWNRLARVQTEAHTKLLDRFSGSDELLAYVQSPAGSQFLQSAPIALDPGTSRRLAAPVSRILWSVQAGLIILTAGFAFNFLSSRVDADVQQGFYVFGVLALAIGAGFILSAGVAYFLSRQLGLFDPPAAPAAGHPRNSLGA